MPRRVRSERSRAPNLARMSAAGIGLHHACYSVIGVSTTGEVLLFELESADSHEHQQMKLWHKSECLYTVRPKEIERWKERKGRIRLLGTQQGSGRIRLELEIEDEDVISLVTALLNDYRLKIRELNECAAESGNWRAMDWEKWKALETIHGHLLSLTKQRPSKTSLKKLLEIVEQTLRGNEE